MREHILSWKCSLYLTGVSIQNPMESLFVCLASIVRHCCEDFLLPSVSLLLNNHGRLGSHVISVQEIVAAIASRDATYDSLTWNSLGCGHEISNLSDD